MSSLLLKNGAVLVHEENDQVMVIDADILIKANVIVKVEKGVQAPDGAVVIDCEDKLISPGFIDTHHHVWQTQLKGRHANDTLLDYMPTGAFQQSNYTTADFYWGQLSGCLEALDAGTTSILDHAHLVVSPEAARTALSATIPSGIRSIFAYAPTNRISGWNPMTIHQNTLEPWVLSTFESLASGSAYANGRVHIGLAFDGWFLPKEQVIDLFERRKRLGVRVLTSHVEDNAQLRAGYFPAVMDSYGVLDENVVLSHCNGISAEANELIRKKGAHVSSTPSTELQMAMGQAVAMDPEMYAYSSLGIDCHSNQSASIVGEMRLGSQAARATRNQKFIEKGMAPKEILPKMQAAFNLGTILGARALRMEDQVGSIAVGKLADLVIFDKTSPVMVCEAEHDPVAAIVLHSSPKDIDMVIVDGVVRKKGGVLVPVVVEKDVQEITRSEKVEWKDVAKELVKSRRNIQEKIDKLDFKNAAETLIGLFHIDESKIVHSL